MTRSEVIAGSLLNILEDIESRMPILLQQFGGNFSENDIREIAKADPTAPGRCAYLPWLLRMRLLRINSTGIEGWDGDAQTMRKLLSDYDKVKKSARFTRIGGKSDIGSYKSAFDLQADVSKALASGWNEELVKQGTQVLNKIDDMVLFKLTNYESARKMATEPGDVPSTDDYAEIARHAGKEEPGWPYCGWCTQLSGHYSRFSYPLYVVKKGSYPFCQVYFNRTTPHSSEIKDHTNKTLSWINQEKIAPLFNVDEFEFLAVNTIDKAQVIKSIKKAASLFIAKNTISYNLETGAVAPKYGSEQEAKQAFMKKLPGIYAIYRRIIDNWDNVTDSKDQAIKWSIASRDKQDTYGEVSPLVAKIRKLKNEIPGMFLSLELFTANCERFL